MSTLRISDAPLLPDVDGTEKIPTGGRGDYAVSIDQIKTFTQGELPQQVEDHISDTSNPHQVTKEQVGLGNVDNTSDINKPISTATQEALDLKANTVDVDAALNLKADKNTTYTKTEVDQALDLKADLVGGVIPSEQLPSYVDDVIEVTTDTLPVVGESGKIYVTTDTNRTWRWSGSQYVEISNGGISDSTLKLQTARKIANVDFDGTQDILIPHNNLVDRDAVGAHPASAILDVSGLSQQALNSLNLTPYHFGGIGDGTYHSLSERYTTLAEAQEVYPFVTSLDESIDACAVQAFFNFCEVNFVENASISFNAYITKPIIRLIRNPKTKVYFGDLTLYSEHQMEYMLRLAGDHCKYFGTIRVSGKEVASFVNRNIKDGIICGGDDVYFMNSYIESVVGVCLQGTAITLHQNCHFTKVNRAESSRCGSCLVGSTNHGLEANILGRSDTGTTIDQRTTLTVDKLPVVTSVVGGGIYDRRNGIFAVINKEIYEVYEIGVNSITVYPRVDSEITTGSLNYIFGGTVALAGNNTAHTSVDKIHAITSGIGLSCRSLYGLSVNTLTTEYCGIGLLVGNRGGAHIGTTIGTFYAEANDWDRVDSWTSNYNSVRILEDVAVSTPKVVSLYDFRNVSTNIMASISSFDYGRLNVGEFSIAGKSYNVASNLDSRNNIVSITDDYNVVAFAATNIVFEVTANADLFRLFKNRFTLINCSSLAGNTKPATLKIRCAVDKAISGLGSPTVVVVGGVSKNEYTIDTAKYTKTIQIALYYNYTNSNFGASILTAIDHVVSVPYTPPSIPANGEVTTTVAMDGVSVGNIVYASFSRYNANVEIYSTVSAANTVTVKFRNTGATAVDFLSGTLTVKAI